MSGRGHSAYRNAGRGGWSTTQPQVLRRLLSLCRSGEGETVCGVELCMLPLRPHPVSVERRLRLVVGVDGPSSGLIPAGGVSRRKASLASSSEAQVSVQGEADVRPGTVVLSNPANAGLCRWSGERLDPAALPPGEILGWAVASWRY